MKKCPNCGAEVEVDANFCTNCGTQLQAAVGQEPGSNSVAQPNGFAFYWEWMVNSWKRPTAKLKTEKWYGIVNILIVILLTTLTIWRLLAGVVAKSVSSSMSSFGEEAQNYANNALGGSISSLSVSAFFAILVVAACFIGFGILGRKFIYGGQEDVLSYINVVAQYSNYNIIISLLMFLLSLISVDTVSIIGILFVVLYYVFLAAGLVPVINNGEGKNDKVWGTLIALLGLIIGSLIAYLIAKSAVMTVISQLTSSLLKF